MTVSQRLKHDGNRSFFILQNTVHNLIKEMPGKN